MIFFPVALDIGFLMKLLLKCTANLLSNKKILACTHLIPIIPELLIYRIQCHCMKAWLIIAVMLKLEKNQAWTGYEPMTSAISVQCSTN